MPSGTSLPCYKNIMTATISATLPDNTALATCLDKNSTYNIINGYNQMCLSLSRNYTMGTHWLTIICIIKLQGPIIVFRTPNCCITGQK